MSVTKVFANQFQQLRKVNTLLLGDVERSRDELKAAYARYVAGPHDTADLNYAVKSAIRCLLGHVDGVSYALRNTVVEAAPSMKMTLAPQDRKFLRKKKLNPRKSLPAGYDFFAQLCGSPLRLDTSTAGWTAFDKLVEARNDFTHPDDIVDIIAVPALRYVKPVLIWFPLVMAELISDCGEKLNAMSRRLPEDLNVRIEIDEATLDIDKIFDTKFFQAVADSAGISIANLRLCLSLLWKETSRAMSDCKSSLPSPNGQYERRLLVRTLFSNIEGMKNLLRFTLAKAVDRGELALPAADLEGMDSGEVEDRLIATATIWSREVGHDCVPRRDKGFAAITVARGIRNRITHPRAVGDLRFTSADMDILLEAADWFISGLSDSLSIDADKWASKLRGVSSSQSHHSSSTPADAGPLDSPTKGASHNEQS